MIKRNGFKTASIIFFSAFTTIAHASIQHASPHFFIQMENQSARDTLLRFHPVTGNVSLEPSLIDGTPLSASQMSSKYGVVFNPLGRDDTFDVVFTGQQDCAFNVAFYAPNNPKITVSGPGCFGGGYRVNGNTLVLYITDIHFNWGVNG